MERSVHRMFKKTLLSLLGLLLLHAAFAQAPELVFRNPVLESGTALQDGATYRFSNITTGVDGLLKVKKRSDASVQLVDIDVANLGWDKALQPRLGISGSIAANQVWWMQFELKFVKTGTTKNIKLKDFVATSIDIDGDNVAIREFVQMAKVKSLAYSSLTYLKTGSTLPESLFNPMDSDGDDHSFNLSGTDNLILGPVTNFTDIDTSATAVMATYTYEDKDAITFVMGATSSAATSSAGIAGLRLNSLWFKSFSLAPQRLLPVKLQSFSAMAAAKAVTLNWNTTSEKDFSHFVIERSADGKSYNDLALVFAAGSATENKYNYQDKKLPAANVVYYRLRMVDEDGTTAYSPVRAVHLGEAGKLAMDVYPNPVRNSVSVNMPAGWQGKAVRLKLYNSSGIIALEKEVRNAGGSATLALTQLPAGLYIIDASCSGETARQRVLKN